MKKILLIAFAIISVSTLSAQYNTMQPRADYRSAFKVNRNALTWSREVVCDKSKAEYYSDIATRMTIATIAENMVIGTIEVDPGANAPYSTSRLPWDSSLVKANVVYELRDDGYKVTVSNILYKHTTDREFSSVFGFIFNSSGTLRARGDGDLRYFDNAFCDLLLIE